MSQSNPIIALAGNPNVGKSTLFNHLTGLKQHTGNWAGVTVACTFGNFTYKNQVYTLVDLPGTYSLDARSEEETLARDFILSGHADCLVLVCDATCLVRGLYFLKQLQTLSQELPLFLCINLCDEAKKKGISIDFSLLQQRLQLPILGTEAHSKRSTTQLKQSLARCLHEHAFPASPPTDWEPDLLAQQCIQYHNPHYRKREEKLDRLLTAPLSGSLFLFLLLLLVFWITISGANYPSALLWKLLHGLESPLYAFLELLHAPLWLKDMLIFGMYRVLSWVVSVMFPPMAIFFPLFTLLEDFGFLPRIAFHLDSTFKKCHACGKQCLTMAMGFGCNAVGVTGCRIIDSPRERLIAILTNALVPCNGRFPTLLLLISLFFMGNPSLSLRHPLMASFQSALCLSLLVLLGVAMTLLSSLILSKTILKGLPSSFTLELPPYRRPQFSQILIRSLLDRTLFVLGRAAVVAAPAGLILWLAANLHISDRSLLSFVTDTLQPLGQLMGLDGCILTAFLLGFPANEIVLPIVLMLYLQNGQLAELSSTEQIFSIFQANGWTTETILCMTVFSLFHWPCSTTCLSIKKETKSLKWTLFAFFLPTFIGCSLCILIHLGFRFLHFLLL
ncbi:MAG: ferrous iron transporter B [bacterium]|nr:ferrous iron transporter B [bacterium]